MLDKGYNRPFIDSAVNKNIKLGKVNLCSKRKFKNHNGKNKIQSREYQFLIMSNQNRFITHFRKHSPIISST